MAAEPKKNRLKTSVDIYNRLLWDNTLGLDKSRIEIIHHDKYEKLKSMSFCDWTPIDSGGDIPFHRIAQFKYNNIILWDRQERIDNINKNSSNKTIDFNIIKQSIYQNNNNENDINNYKDPTETSEYISDCQFLSLLKMEPKNVCLLYKKLDEMINNSFITQRPNNIEILSRHLCIKYLSYIQTIQKHKYYLFGSTKIGLNTHKSDLDIRIKPSNNSKITTRDQSIQLLKRLKFEFQQLKKNKPLYYSLKTKTKTQTECINITFNDFKNDKNNNEIIKLENKINIFYNNDLEFINVNISSLRVSDSVIPRFMISFIIKVISKEKKIVQKFEISMDITISINKDEIRNKHLRNWVNKYCINNVDKRIYKFLFSVKLWAQYFKINISINSTINGYGWIHIALFVLTHYYKQTETENENKEYESIYSDINIPISINCNKLFILFIEMIHNWICYDEIKENNPSKIIRRGMNIISGKWINNIRRYTLFVADPFCENNNLPNNLSKCVRHKKGIPALINAIKSTIKQLQFAAHESIKHNENNICKHIKFFNTQQRTIIINNEIKENENDDDEFKDDDDDDEFEEDGNKYYSWKQLCNFNLNLPKRKWIQQNNNNNNNNDIISICEFNCLAQNLTSGESEHNQFKTNNKYLEWGYRSKRILYEILQYKCDIICLCEVDAIHYKMFYYPNLSKSSFKYDGLFLCKNNPNKHQINNSKRKFRIPSDGVAIFWNSNKFSCYNKFEVILGRENKSYHIALGIRLKYKNGNKLSSDFDVWCTHLKAGRNNKAENWRLAQVNTLLYYITKYSKNIPILFCGDLNSHYHSIINNDGDLVEAKVYPAILNGKVKSSKSNKNNKKSNINYEYVLKFESLWNNKIRNTFSTWAGWKDRDVKCCLDYIMIGNWNKILINNKNNDNNNNNNNKCNKESIFELKQILDVWDEKEIEKFEAKLPNRIYPSDHLLIAAKIAIKTE